MMKKAAAAILALAVTTGMFAGCYGGGSSTSSGEESHASSEGNTEGKIDTSKEVNLVMYLYGSEGVANQSILKELNSKLKEKINATLEIKYIDWGNISTKYPLLWASGEEFDMSYVASNASVPYATLAKQDVLADITDMLDKYAPTLKTAINDSAWNSMKVGGRIYGVPSTYSEFTAYGFVTRKDILEKAGLEKVSSIEDMEKYMDAALSAGFVPLNGSSNLAMDLYRMFIATTSDWLDAPGIPESEMYLAFSASNGGKIFHPAFTDEFEKFAAKMAQWSEKGYWSKDVLSAAQDDKDNFYNGLSAAYITHQPDWTGSYGLQLQKGLDVETEFYTFAEANNKIVKKMGCENATGISVNSKYPERCLMLIEQLMTDKECYDLFQYGIEGVQYKIVDGKITKPDGFDEKTQGGGFAGWALRTDALNIPSVTEDPRRYTLNEAWNKVAIDNPFVGFSFDNKNVSAELSSIANVDSQLGIQILLGKTSDAADSVSKYREQLKTAGVDTVVDEVNKQYEAFKAQ